MSFFETKLYFFNFFRSTKLLRLFSGNLAAMFNLLRYAGDVFAVYIEDEESEWARCFVQSVSANRTVSEGYITFNACPFLSACTK